MMEYVKESRRSDQQEEADEWKVMHVNAHLSTERVMSRSNPHQAN